MKNKEKAAQNLEWNQNQSMEAQISLLGNLLEVAKLLSNQMLKDEVKEKAGLRYTSYHYVYSNINAINNFYAINIVMCT